MAKKKILLLSDDLRMNSGVGTMSKEFVLGTLHHYDWVQIGGAITHPEHGKRVDMNEAIKEELGIDGSLIIYPTNGYGNPELIRNVLNYDFGDGYMKWNTRYDKRFLYFIITFGTIGQLLIITNFFMKVQI